MVLTLALPLSVAFDIFSTYSIGVGGFPMHILKTVPPQFGRMSMRRFKALIAEIPRGDRLLNSESWSECIYVATFLRLLKEKRNPIEGYVEDWVELGDVLEGRPLRVCLAFVRWFGTNCGRAWVDEVIEQDGWERNTAFCDTWEHYALWWPGERQRKPQITLDQLLNEAQAGFPLSDFATPADREVAYGFLAWLDVSGWQFIIEALAAIDIESKRLEEERRIARQTPLIEEAVSRYRQKLFTEAKIPVPAT